MAYIDGSERTFLNGSAAIPAGTRVKISSGALAAAGADVKEIGTAKYRIEAGAYGAVILTNAPGTVEMIASEDIAAYDTVYGAADGKILKNKSSSEIEIGIALETASGNGAIIEVLRIK